jgi:coenzyme PQQ precursor peptide PqqA
MLRLSFREGGVAVESHAVENQHSDEWEAPEFDEVAVAPEVTMYIAQLD